MKKYGIFREEYFRLLSFVTGKNKPQRIMGWMSSFLERSDCTEEEYGAILSILQDEANVRTLIGPYNYVPIGNPQVLIEISIWSKGLRALNGKRSELIQFIRMFFGDLEMSQWDKDLLFRRLQNARRKQFPAFKWKSEVLRGLRNFEKQPAHKLYTWAHQGEKHGIQIPDLIQIVSEMKKRSIPDGPCLVTLDLMRDIKAPETKPEPQPEPKPEPQITKMDILEGLKPTLDKLMAVHARRNPVYLLRYLYKHHTPKGPLPADMDFTSGKMKKHIISALRLYHPDKQNQYGDFGLEWEVLCEQISKCVNQYL